MLVLCRVFSRGSSQAAVRSVADADPSGSLGAVLAASNLLLAPSISLGFAAAGMLSPHGHCQTFDASADGYVRAEGIGAAWLETARLETARAAEARRLALGGPWFHVPAAEARSDGKRASLTAPSGQAQLRLA